MKPSEVREEAERLRSWPMRTWLVVIPIVALLAIGGLVWTCASKVTETVAESRAQGWMAASSAPASPRWPQASIPWLHQPDGGTRNGYSGDWCMVDKNLDGDRLLGFCFDSADACVAEIHEWRQMFIKPPEQKCQVITSDTTLYCAAVTSGPNYWPDGAYFVHNDTTTICYFESKNCQRYHVCSQITKASLSP